MKNEIVIKFRPFSRHDVPNYVRWLNNPEANRFIGDKRITTKSATKWFDNYIKDKNKRFFVISEGTKAVGFMGLSNISRRNRNADLFICIGEDEYRGMGLGRNAMQWLIDYGFNKLKLHKISLGVFEENVVAIKLYKSLGFEIEGKMKDEAFFRGKFHDMFSMALFNSN
ncbi:GNAT family N-acetyltransferase [Patescibacteria group bacterium]|nr:GNAT family N-acetyltransferase [Patescibacteria group bacterium]